MKVDDLQRLIVENANIKFERTDHPANGISKRGVLTNTPYDKLVATFGQPNQVQSDGVRVEWSMNVTDGNNTYSVSIYDWYEDVPVDQVKDWNVASNQPYGYLLVHSLVK